MAVSLLAAGLSLLYQLRADESHPESLVPALPRNRQRRIANACCARSIIVEYRPPGGARASASPKQLATQSQQIPARSYSRPPRAWPPQQGAEGVWAIDAKGTISPAGDPLASPAGARSQRSSSRANFAGGGELWESQSRLFPGRARALGLRLPGRRASPARPIFSQRYSTTSNRKSRSTSASSSRFARFKRQILLTLSLFTILLLFSATWSALYLSKQVTVPIQALAEATREIAAGHFDTQVQVQAQDELGLAGALLQRDDRAACRQPPAD